MGRKICCQSFTAVKEPVQATLQLALLSAPAAWPTSEAGTRAGRVKLGTGDAEGLPSPPPRPRTPAHGNGVGLER
jgi:hypothetical protein